MIDADDFIGRLANRGAGLLTGVPCSYLTPLINAAMDSNRLDYVNVGNEGEAIAVAAGFSIGTPGGTAVAMFQNSGLGNAVSPLTSLTWTFKIPVLVIVTHRGQPGGPPDEPQHELMGQITTDLLNAMQIPHRTFPREADQIDEALDEAFTTMRQTLRPYALVMQKGSVTPRSMDQGQTSVGQKTIVRTASMEPDESVSMDVDLVLRTIIDASPTDLRLATTGFTGRALYAVEDMDNHFYMVGSMGCLSTFALGLATACPHRRIVAIDGDGSVLMRTGGLAAVGGGSPPNLLHVVLDNGVHDSTGAQQSLSSTVDFLKLGEAMGYASADRADNLDAIRRAVISDQSGPRLLVVRTRPRADRTLPRPKITPPQVCQRLQQFLSRNH